jgi:hypothetical protein
MKPNALPIAFNNSGARLEELLALAPRPPLQEIAFGFIAVLYRRLAVGGLLMDGTPERFFSYLFNSSRAYTWFLENGPAAEKLASKADAFFDAVACHDDEGALRMVAAAPPATDVSKEYEEDFFAVRILMDMFFGNNDQTVIRTWLAAWEVLAAANPDTRLGVCKALILADQSAFDEALSADLAGRATRLAQARKQESLDPDEACTTAIVSTEVLAWLDLAGRIGLKTASNYPFAPSVARHFALLSRPAPDDWLLSEPFGAFDGE